MKIHSIAAFQVLVSKMTKAAESMAISAHQRPRNFLSCRRACILALAEDRGAKKNQHGFTLSQIQRELKRQGWVFQPGNVGTTLSKLKAEGVTGHRRLQDGQARRWVLE